MFVPGSPLSWLDRIKFANLERARCNYDQAIDSLLSAAGS